MTALQRWRVRKAMAKWCLWGINHEGPIHYAQVRPMPLPPPGTLPLTTDCSGLATLFAKWSGAPDPNGRAYDGSGFTGTMAAHQLELGIKDIHRGDYVIFGNPTTTHVAVVIDRPRFRWRITPDRLILMSHGMERGPLRISLANEAMYHEGEGGYRFFSLLHAKG